jgi:hypothetical protein
VGAYLESLLSRINTPLLERFNVTLFTQLTFKLPRLCHFTRTIEGLRHPGPNVVFNRDGVSFITGAHRFGDGPFSLKVRCKQLGWQIAAATQVCNSVAEDVNLSLTVVHLLGGMQLMEQRGVSFSGHLTDEEASHRLSTCIRTPRCSGVVRGRVDAMATQAPRHLAPVETEHANPSSTLIDSPPFSPSLSVYPLPIPVHHPQHAHSTDSFVMVDREVMVEQEVG